MSLKHCPKCNYLNSVSKFFCDECGEPLFDSGPGAGQPVAEVAMLPPIAPANLMAQPGPPAPVNGNIGNTGYGAAPPGYGPPPYQPGYPVGIPPVVVYQPRQKEGFSEWGIGKKLAILGIGVVGIFLIVSTAIYAFWMVNQPKAKLDAEPPAGWTMASESYRQEIEDKQNNAADTPDISVDYLYVTSTDGEMIVVTHQKKYAPLDNPSPDTTDVEEMNRWLEENGRELEDSIRVAAIARNAGTNAPSAVKLEKGDVAIHFDIIYKTTQGETVNKACFLFCKHSTVYTVLVQTVNRGMDENAVKFIRDNLYFK